MPRSYRDGELVDRYCDLIRERPGWRPSLREFAAHVALTPPALYRYVSSIEELEHRAEARLWERVADEVGPDTRLSTWLPRLVRTCPGWLTYLADFNRPHVVPSSAIALFPCNDRPPGSKPSAFVATDLTLGFVCSSWQALRDVDHFIDALSQQATAAHHAIELLSALDAPVAVGLATGWPSADQLYQYILDGNVDLSPEVTALIEVVRRDHRFPSVREMTELFGSTIGGLYASSSKADLYAALQVGLFRASAGLVQQRLDQTDPRSELRGAWLMFTSITVTAPYLAAMQVDWSDRSENPSAWTLDRLTNKYGGPLGPSELPATETSRMLMGFVMRRGHLALAGDDVVDSTIGIIDLALRSMRI